MVHAYTHAGSHQGAPICNFENTQICKGQQKQESFLLAKEREPPHNFSTFMSEIFAHIFVHLRKIPFSLISYLTELVKISGGGGLDGNL